MLEKSNDMPVEFLERRGYKTNCSEAVCNVGEKRNYEINTPHGIVATECGIGWIVNI